MEALANNEILLFKGFRLDQRGLFRRDEGGVFVPVAIGSRGLDLLRVLIAARGDLVSKNEVLAAVWPGIVVARDNLKVQISALRKALGEDRELIRTENGRGYRFTAAVRVTAAGWECLSTRRAAKPPNGRNAVFPADLSVIASRLTRLEVRLAEALRLVGTDSSDSRSRRRRHCVAHSSRRTRGRRPIGSPSPETTRREKSFDLAC